MLLLVCCYCQYFLVCLILELDFDVAPLWCLCLVVGCSFCILVLVVSCLLSDSCMGCGVKCFLCGGLRLLHCSDCKIRSGVILLQPVGPQFVKRGLIIVLGRRRACLPG